MHVLILPSEQFVPPHDHLAGTFQFDQARILKKAGYEIRVISIELKFSLPMILKGMLFKPLGKKIGNATDGYSFRQLVVLLGKKMLNPASFISIGEKEGIPVYRTEGFYLLPPSGKHDYKWWVKAGLAAFKKYIHEHGKPDIIHAHNALYAGLLADKIRSVYAIPYVLTEHSSYYARNLYHASLLSKAGKAFGNASRVLVVSNFLGKGLDDIFGKTFKWKTLANVAEPVFEDSVLAEKEYNKTFSFVSIGSLIKLKQHALLIEAFHRAFENNEEVSLEIIGDGEEEATLRKLITTLGESSRVFLKGRLSKREILYKLDSVNVLCLQSEYETFGVVILEALLRGVPVVTTQCGGPADIIGLQDGISVPVNDVEALRNGLLTIRDKYKNYDPGLIRQNAIKRFGSAHFLAQLSGIYKEHMN